MAIMKVIEVLAEREGAPAAREAASARGAR